MAMSLPVFRNLNRYRTRAYTQTLVSVSRLLSVSRSSCVSENLELSKNEVQPSIQDVDYPPIKPKFPPGQWGEMDHRYAWIWQKSKEELLNIPDVKGRLEYLNSSEMTSIYAIPYNDHPNYLKFASFVSKTHIMPWTMEKPDVYLEAEAEVNQMNLVSLKQSLIDQIIIEMDMMVREDYLNKQKMLSKLILRCVADTLVTHLSDKCEHLRTSMYDEDVFVRTFWDRHGLERQRRVRQGVDDHYTLKTVQDQRIISSCTFDGMLRCDLPLPQV